MKGEFLLGACGGLVVLLHGLACTAVLHDDEPIPASLHPELTAATLSTDSVVLRVTYQVRNDGPSPLYFRTCTVNLQRRVEESWRTVWDPLCALSSHRKILAAGSSDEFSVLIAHHFGVEEEPWRPPAQGTYRLSMFASDGERSMTVTSSPFDLD